MGKIQGFDPLFFLLCCQQRKKLLTKNGIRNILCLSNSLTIKIKRIQQMYKGEKKMLEKITEIIAEQLDVDAASINAGTSFKDDLEADSLDLFELIMAVEEEYGVEIPSEDLENIKTVQDIMDYLTAKGVEA